MKTSILERKINEDPLAWGSPEMIRLAKKRIKSGLPAFGDTVTASESSVEVTPDKTSPSISKQKPEAELVKNEYMVTSNESSCYPKIRAKYDLLIIKVMESKIVSQRDKKTRIKNLEFRYENEIQEKKYQKYTLWSLAGFLAITASLLYAEFSII